MAKLSHDELAEALEIYDEGRSARPGAWFAPDARADVASAWYPVDDPLPALGVQVRVRWHVDGIDEGGRGYRRAATYIVVAARVREPMAIEGWVWLAMTQYHRYADGTIERLGKPRAVSLNPDRGQIPTAWQPLYPERWKAPLPPPLDVTRLVLPPEPVRATGPALADGRAPWWLDPSEITYSEPGHITWREAEGRVCRALWSTAWVVRDGPRAKSFSDILARMADERDLEARKQMQDTSRRNVPWQPTGRDDDDFLTAMGWFAELVRVSGWRKARVVMARASHRPDSWARIAGRLHNLETGKPGCQVATARKLYTQAVNMIVEIANNPQDWPNMALAELKERNRRAKG